MVFPKVFEGDDVLVHIFPTKQRDVQKAIELARQDPRIDRIVVFGSAVSLKCGDTSDLDLAIFAPGISFDEFVLLARPFLKELDTELDLIHYEDIHNDLLREEINKKGVEIYAKCS